jgi:hypothetical protein
MVKDALIKELFIKNFKELLQDLSRLYPNDNTLRLCFLSFNTFASINPDYIIKETKLYLEPYKDKILEKDEKFLMEEVEKDFSQEEHSWILDEMKRVKDIWRSPDTTRETKDNIWKYLTNFIKLGAKCCV